MKKNEDMIEEINRLCEKYPDLKATKEYFEKLEEKEKNGSTINSMQIMYAVAKIKQINKNASIIKRENTKEEKKEQKRAEMDEMSAQIEDSILNDRKHKYLKLAGVQPGERFTANREVIYEQLSKQIAYLQGVMDNARKGRIKEARREGATGFEQSLLGEVHGPASEWLKSCDRYIKGQMRKIEKEKVKKQPVVEQPEVLEENIAKESVVEPITHEDELIAQLRKTMETARENMNKVNNTINEEKQTVEEQTVEEQTVEEQTVEEQAVEEQTVEEQAVEESVVEESVIEEPVVEKTTVEELSDESLGLGEDFELISEIDLSKEGIEEIEKPVDEGLGIGEEFELISEIDLSKEGIEKIEEPMVEEILVEETVVQEPVAEETVVEQHTVVEQTPKVEETHSESNKKARVQYVYVGNSKVNNESDRNDPDQVPDTIPEEKGEKPQNNINSVENPIPSKSNNKNDNEREIIEGGAMLQVENWASQIVSKYKNGEKIEDILKGDKTADSIAEKIKKGEITVNDARKVVNARMIKETGKEDKKLVDAVEKHLLQKSSNLERDDSKPEIYMPKVSLWTKIKNVFKQFASKITGKFGKNTPTITDKSGITFETSKNSKFTKEFNEQYNMYPEGTIKNIELGGVKLGVDTPKKPGDATVKYITEKGTVITTTYNGSIIVNKRKGTAEKHNQNDEREER